MRRFGAGAFHGVDGDGRESGNGEARLKVFSDHHVERGGLGFWYGTSRNIFDLVTGDHTDA